MQICQIPHLLVSAVEEITRIHCIGRLNIDIMEPNIAQKTIVILGGSYAGVSAAHYILKHTIPKLPEKESYQVVMVSTSLKVVCRPACVRALLSDDMFPEDQLFVNVTKGFDQYMNKFKFIHGTATHVDASNRVVAITLPDGTPDKIDFYALVIATGAVTSSPMFSLNPDDKALKSSWVDFRKALPTAKSITICGGGPTSIETAGEIGEHLNGRAWWFQSKLNNPAVPITLYTSAANILPVLRPTIALKAEKFLAKVGVTVVKNTRITNVMPDGAGINNTGSKATLTFEDGTTMKTDIYISAIGTKPNTSFLPRDLLAEDGRVETNASTLRVDKAGPLIYGVGDATTFARPAIHNIMAAIPALGANIKRDLLLASGKELSSIGEDRLFKEDTRETQFVPVGKSKGVGAAFGYQFPSFFVWLIKGRDYWIGKIGDFWSGKRWEKES